MTKSVEDIDCAEESDTCEDMVSSGKSAPVLCSPNHASEGVSASGLLINANVTTAGIYSLQILLDGSHVEGSPVAGLRVEAGETSAAHSTIGGEEAPVATAGTKALFAIRLSDRFGNAILRQGEFFRASQSGPDASESPFSGGVTYTPEDGYILSFTAGSPGLHRISLRHDSGIVSGSSFDVTATLAPTSSAMTYAIWPGTVSAGVSTEVEIVPINLHGLPQGSLGAGKVADDFVVTIKPDGPRYGSVTPPTEVTLENGETRYRFSIHAELFPYSDMGLLRPYEVSISLKSGSKTEGIANSPFLFFLSPDIASPSTSRIYEGGAITKNEEGSFSAVAGSNANLLLQLKDRFSNDIQYDPYSSSGEVIVSLGSGSATEEGTALDIKDLQDGRYQISISEKVAGLYNVNTLLNGKFLEQVPAIQILPGDNFYPMFKVSVEPMLVAGTEYFVEVQPKDAFGNDRVDDGSLTCIANSSACAVDAPQLSINCGLRVGQGNLWQTLQRVPCPVQYSGDGNYVASVKPFAAGDLVTSVSVCPADGSGCTHGTDWPVASSGSTYLFNPEALPVGISPYYSAVAPASPSASAFTLSGAALNGVVYQGSKAAVSLSIAPKDAYGNTLALGEGSLSDFKILLSVQSTDEGLAEITDYTISSVEDGKAFNLEFSVDRLGLLEVEILFKNVPIVGNPFRIPVYAASEDIDPALTEFDVLLLQGMVGEKIGLDVVLMTSAPAASCYSDDTGSLISDASARIEKALEPGCGGIAHSSSKGADYVNILSDFQELSVSDNADGTYSASVRFTETDIHVIDAKIGPDTGSKFVGDGTRAIGTGLSRKMKIYSGRTETAALKDLEGALITGLQELVAGVPFKFNVYPADEFGNMQDYVYHKEDEFRVLSVHNLLGLETSAECAKKMYEGIGIATFYFSCSMTATVAGDYSLDVAFRERGSSKDFERISGISIELRVRQNFPDWERSQISGEGLNEAYVGSESFVRLNLIDAYGNEVYDGSNVAEFVAYGESPVNATLVETVTSSSIPLNVQYNEDLREYQATYTPEVSGVFSLNVFVAGKLMQIPGYENTVLRPGTIEPSRCIAWGAGVGESGPIAAGVSQKFLIQAMDSQGNQLAEGGATFKAILRSAEQPDPILNSYVDDGRVITSLQSITDFGNGLYEVSYEPRIASTYLLEVSRGGSHIVGSPFVVEVKAAPTEANQTQVYCDPGIPFSLETNMAGRESFFFVQARDKYSGNRTDFDDLFYYFVTSDAGFSKESIAAPRGNDYGGVYQGSFSVQTAGQIRVAVMFGSELAAEFTSLIVPGPVDSTNCALLSSDFPETNVYSSSGSPHEIVLASMDRFSNRVYEGGREVKGLLVKSDGTLTQELSFSDNGDGTYTALYINKEPGDYTVTATVDGENVLPRPLRLVAGDLVLRKTAVSSSAEFKDSGGIGDIHIGESLKFFLSFTDEWGNVREGRSEDLTSVKSSLSIKIDGEEREVEIKISDLVEPAGVYQVEFDALLTGEMEFLLKQNYKGSDNMVSFPGSLVSTVPDVSRSSVYGPGVTAVVGGSVVRYFTDMKDKHGNTLTEVLSLPSVSLRLLSSEGPSQEELDGEVRDITRGGGSLVIVEYKLPAFGQVYSVEITTSVVGATVSVNTVRVAVMTGLVAPSRSILQDFKSRQIKETTLTAT